jgi:DNA-3-methyladenine glycosylase II
VGRSPPSDNLGVRMSPLDTSTAVKHLSRVDPVMRGLIKAVGPCQLKPGARGDHFTTLLRAIVGQQLSAKAAETIWQRLIALHENGRKLKPEDVLDASDAQLRSVGLSNAKTVYAKDLASKIASGELHLSRMSRLDDDAIVDELVAVKGIGRWTAEMFMLFKLGRPDIWPVDDLGIRNAIKNQYGVEPTKAKMIEIAEPWRPWRSVASWYLWRSLALTAPSLGNASKNANKAVPV